MGRFKLRVNYCVGYLILYESVICSVYTSGSKLYTVGELMMGYDIRIRKHISLLIKNAITDISYRLGNRFKSCLFVCSIQL